jgi:hypothetical protein
MTDSAGLPVAGADQTRKVLDESHPTNSLMEA